MGKLLLIGISEKKELAFMDRAMRTTLAFAKPILLTQRLYTKSFKKTIENGASNRKMEIANLMNSYGCNELRELGEIAHVKEWHELLDMNLIYEGERLFTVERDGFKICFEINLYNHGDFLEKIIHVKKIFNKELVRSLIDHCESKRLYFNDNLLSLIEKETLEKNMEELCEHAIIQERLRYIIHE